MLVSSSVIEGNLGLNKILDIFESVLHFFGGISFSALVGKIDHSLVVSVDDAEPRHGVELREGGDLSLSVHGEVSVHQRKVCCRVV